MNPANVMVSEDSEKDLKGDDQVRYHLRILLNH